MSLRRHACTFGRYTPHFGDSDSTSTGIAFGIFLENLAFGQADRGEIIFCAFCLCAQL